MGSSRLWLYLLVGLSVATGTALTLYQIFALSLPLEPTTEEALWTVEAKVTFKAKSGKPVIAQLLLPRPDGSMVGLSESFVSRNYGVNVEAHGHNRKAVWSIRRASGPQSLYYRTVVAPRTGPPPPPDKAHEAIEPPTLAGAEALAVQALVDSIRSQSGNVRTFTAKAVKLLNDVNDNNARLLVGRERDPAVLARVAMLVLASARIPGRIMHAVPLRDAAQVEPIDLIAAWDGQQWVYFDPMTGTRLDPTDVLLWWQGDEPLLEVDGGSRAAVEFSVSGSKVAALALARETGRLEGSPWFEFSLMSLPLQTQQVYQIVMMLPIGVAVIVLLRTFVGVETFGTFMPALIALAFRETELLWGVLLFAILIAIGMAVRAFLDQLKLLLVPRLAVVLTIVVLAMAGISIVSHKLGLERGLSVALFPMVIITMTIERMSIVWEERGGTKAIAVAGGSLLAASLAYLAMTNRPLTHLVFTFPGTLLILIGLLLLAGSYRGYRLAELGRFRELARG